MDSVSGHTPLVSVCCQSGQCQCTVTHLWCQFVISQDSVSYTHLWCQFAVSQDSVSVLSHTFGVSLLSVRTVSVYCHTPLVSVCHQSQTVSVYCHTPLVSVCHQSWTVSVYSHSPLVQTAGEPWIETVLRRLSTMMQADTSFSAAFSI